MEDGAQEQTRFSPVGSAMKQEVNGVLCYQVQCQVWGRWALMRMTFHSRGQMPPGVRVHAA